MNCFDFYCIIIYLYIILSSIYDCSKFLTTYVNFKFKFLEPLKDIFSKYSSGPEEGYFC